MEGDALLRGGSVVNVHTGEVLEGWDVAITGARIASVEPRGRCAVGPMTRILDISGQVVAPGFIDGHTHMDHPACPAAVAPWALAGGTTTIVTEVETIASAMGRAGVEWFLDASQALPVRFYATAPTITYLCADDGEGRPILTRRDMEDLLRHPRILGLGEVYWHRLRAEPERILPLIETCGRLGKTVEGHTAGARGADLQACVAAGLSSCHEAITAEQALERLRLGLFVMLREGSVRRDLEALAPLRHAGVSLHRAALISDTVWPDDLMVGKYMSGVVQRAVELGFDPIQAIQMVTLNVARYFGLRDLGAIAPGYRADLVVFRSLEELSPVGVIAGGRLAVWDGEPEVEAPAPAMPVVASPAFPRPLRPEDFELPTRRREGAARVRAIEIKGDILTAERILELPIQNRRLVVDPDAGVWTVAAFDRHGRGRLTTGVVAGFGRRAGAAATSVTFDTADVVVVGSGREAMVSAVRAVLQAGGGYSVVRDGHTELLPLPVGGVLSARPVPEIAAGFAAIRSSLSALNPDLRNPLLTLQALTFSAIPALRITSSGLVDVKGNRRVDLLVEA